MDIHEYQAKEILAKYHIPVGLYDVVASVDELKKAAQKFSSTKAVLKVQVHAGGRGKAGGVLIASGEEEIIAKGSTLLGKKIVNNQTGPAGLVSHKIIIAEAVEIAQELYLGIILDRALGAAKLIVSAVGGMDIEKVAEEQPDQVKIIEIPARGFLYDFEILQICKFLKLRGKLFRQFISVVKGLIKAYFECDATLLEINPLVIDKSGAILALDCKLNIDDNALFRQKLIESYFDASQVSKYEAEAKKADLSYVFLDGDIGCMVNGAGLAMATMDIIAHYGGNAANFLDVGGSATSEKIEEGMRIILSDTRVKAILINIFGGIMSCATVAKGIVEAISSLNVTLPVIVRLEGTHFDQAREILKSQSLSNLQLIDDLAPAAKKVVELTTTV